MNIGEIEKSANIIKILMKQELMEKDNGRKHQEIENQMYTPQGKSKAMQISIGTNSYLLMIGIEKNSIIEELVTPTIATFFALTQAWTFDLQGPIFSFNHYKYKIRIGFKGSLFFSPLPQDIFLFDFVFLELIVLFAI